MSKVSVVLAAYRGEKYIADQLWSLFAQTYPLDEILIGDDSPDDATETAVRGMLHRAPSHCRVDYCRNGVQLGVDRNFEALMRKASGDLIFICDQDDIWSKRKIERMVVEMEAHPECELLSCGSTQFEILKDEADGRCRRIYRAVPMPSGELLKKVNEENPFLLLRYFCPAQGHNFAIRRSFLKIILPFQNDFECYDFWIFCAAIMTGKIRVMNQSLAWQRVHGQNCSCPYLLSEQKNPLIARFRTMRMNYFGTDEITSVFNRFRKLLEFSTGRLAEYAVPELVEQLRLLSAFYALRMTIRQSHLFSRVFYCLKHQADYRFHASGIRSMIRDIIF